MKKLLLLAALAGCTFCSQGCSEKDETAPASLSQLIQGTWRLATTENAIPLTNGMPAIGTPTTLVKDYKFGDIVVDWASNTAEEYIVGSSQGAVNYTLADSTLTITTARRVTSTGQILTLTKDRLRIARTPILFDSPSSSSKVIFNYVR